MCGIIAVVSGRSPRQVPGADEVLGLLDRAVGAGDDLATVAGLLSEVDVLLRGEPGIELLAGNLGLAGDITRRLPLRVSCAVFLCMHTPFPLPVRS